MSTDLPLTPELRACLHIDCPHHVCVLGPGGSVVNGLTFNSLEARVARNESQINELEATVKNLCKNSSAAFDRIKALEDRPTIQWWPTYPSAPGGSTGGGYWCMNCRTWVSFGFVHVCNWTVGNAGG